MKKNIIASALLCISVSSIANTIEPSTQFQIEQQQQQNPVINGGPTFTTVANSGADQNDCEFRVGSTVIQDAIDDPMLYDEIRVVVGTYPENLSIDDRDVSIKGGYASCADAIADIVTFDNQGVDTIIQPDFPVDNPVVTIVGDDDTRDTVNLTNLRLTGGINNFLLISGGISTFSDNLQLNLTHMWIDGNEGQLGGGIGIGGGNTDVYARNLMLLGNTAEQGGGLFCTGDETSVVVDYNVPATDRFGILGNTATDATEGNGGGILATNGCSVSVYTGTSTPSISDPFDVRGVLLNQAAVNGGGVAAITGATVGLYGSQFCFFGCSGDNENPVLVFGNTADSDDNLSGHGGGVFVADTDSAGYLSNGWVSSNTAYRGGGISVQDDAEINLSTVFTSFFGSNITCWSPGSCNRIEFNQAGNTAGGIRVGSGGVANVNHSHIQSNRSDFAVAFYVAGAGSTLNLESSLLTDNGDDGSGTEFNDDYVVMLESGGDVNIAFTTIADNNALSSTLRAVSSGTLSVGSSIIHESNGLTVYTESSPGTVEFDCVMANEIASIPGGFGLVVDDPDFVDRNNGDFHLDVATSPAIDFCDDLATSTTLNDIDNEARGWDWSNISNTNGPFDLGFDEQSDLIFADDFEAVML
ncbi:MAG: hypothetical protein ACSHWU_05325 [Marinicella sp.]